MKAKPNPGSGVNMPDEIREYLETTPRVSTSAKERLRRAGLALRQDPKFESEFLSDYYTERLLSHENPTK